MTWHNLLQPLRQAFLVQWSVLNESWMETQWRGKSENSTLLTPYWLQTHPAPAADGDCWGYWSDVCRLSLAGSSMSGLGDLLCWNHKHTSFSLKGGKTGKQWRKAEIEPSLQTAELRNTSDSYMTTMTSINSSAFSTWLTNRSMWLPDVRLGVLSFTECCSFNINVMPSRKNMASGIIIIKDLLKKSLS